MDISKEEHTKISPRAEKKMDSAEEDDGVGVNSKDEKEMGISNEDFILLASILEMHTLKICLS